MVELSIKEKIAEFGNQVKLVETIKHDLQWKPMIKPKNGILEKKRLFLKQNEEVLEQWRQEIIEHWQTTDPEHFAIKEVLIPNEIHGQGSGVMMHPYYTFRDQVISDPTKLGLRPGQMLRIRRDDGKFNDDYYFILDRYGAPYLVDWEYKSPNFDIVNYYLSCGLLMKDLTRVQTCKGKLG